jgi:hypothetical protein
MPPIDRNELRRLALLLSLGGALPACGGPSATAPRHGDPTAGGASNAGPAVEGGATSSYCGPGMEAYADAYGNVACAPVGPTSEYCGPGAEAYFDASGGYTCGPLGGPAGEAYYGPTGEGSNAPVYEG